MLSEPTVSLLSSLQGLLHSMLGFLVAFWVLVLTISIGSNDPRLKAMYGRVSNFFLFLTAEILAAEVTTALAIAYRHTTLADVSFVLGALILTTVVIGFLLLHRLTLR